MPQQTVEKPQYKKAVAKRVSVFEQMDGSANKQITAQSEPCSMGSVA